MNLRLAATAAAFLALTACGSASSSPTVTVTTTVTAVAESAPPEEVVEGEPGNAGDEAAAGGVSAFGESVTLPENEGTIMISAPEPFTPSDTASVEGTWDEYVVMTVTETNDSAEPVMAGWSIQATTGDKAASSVFDSAQEISSPTVDIMPGKSITYKVVFGRTKGAEFVVSAAPLAGWSTAYFQ